MPEAELITRHARSGRLGQTTSFCPPAHVQAASTAPMLDVYLFTSPVTAGLLCVDVDSVVFCTSAWNLQLPQTAALSSSTGPSQQPSPKCCKYSPCSQPRDGIGQETATEENITGPFSQPTSNSQAVTALRALKEHQMITFVL
ncbi:hypothetical protein DFH94DRAFT_687436 [Russula ochroleuca]|uniref:Uncharacterized protein n=1 Tax=Russula ochroleuca TaxID=152965 RepID=A0A9P5N5Y6_9AGAM|nr:hypothetical protein DFH94DRAFT_687436 [Russula ochroleuca]